MFSLLKKVILGTIVAITGYAIIATFYGAMVLRDYYIIKTVFG